MPGPAHGVQAERPRRYVPACTSPPVQNRWSAELSSATARSAVSHRLSSRSRRPARRLLTSPRGGPGPRGGRGTGRRSRQERRRAAASAAAGPPSWNAALIASARGSAARVGPRVRRVAPPRAACRTPPLDRRRKARCGRDREKLRASAVRRACRQAFADECRCSRSVAAQPGRVCRLREEQRPLERIGRNAAARSKPPPPPRKLRGHGSRPPPRPGRPPPGVGPCRRGCRMPRVSKLIAPFQHVRKGPVCVASLGGRRAVVQRRTNERMAERDLGPVDADEVGVLCKNEIRRTRTERAARGLDKGQRAGVIGGRNEQSSARSPSTSARRANARWIPAPTGSSPSNGARPRSCASLNVAGNSSNASGFPCVSSMSLSTCPNDCREGGGIVMPEPGQHELLDTGASNGTAPRHERRR